MSALIELNQLYKNYESEGIVTPVLKDVEMLVGQGEFMAIMGPSGSGKTTLMNIIGTLDHATGGEYLLQGRDITHMPDEELAQVRNQLIGFVFQGFNLLPRRSVLENVALPMFYRGIGRKERNEMAMEYLEQVNLTHRADYLPTQLSGGQQQRVAIARALAGKPELILADEPTGNLDSKTSDEIMDLFRNLNKQAITVILVTHEQDVARYADRLVQIKDGEIIYDGEMY